MKNTKSQNYVFVFVFVIKNHKDNKVSLISDNSIAKSIIHSKITGTRFIRLIQLFKKNRDSEKMTNEDFKSNISRARNFKNGSFQEPQRLKSTGRRSQLNVARPSSAREQSDRE